MTRAVTPPTASVGRTLLNKVPEVTLLFWVIKIMATTVGETAADYLAGNLGFGLTATTLIMTVLLCGALVLQFRRNRYVPWVYWLAIVLISVVGTLFSDNLVDNFGVSLWTTTALFGVLMAGAFGAWYRVEKTLSIHHVDTPKREAFYWTAILFAFALGTSAGDLISEKLDLGYWKSIVLFGALIALVAAGRFVAKLSATLTFWVAYVLTRPLGASIGDYLSQKRRDGGLGLGTTGTSIIFLVIIVGLVGWFTIEQRNDTKELIPA